MVLIALSLYNSNFLTCEAEIVEDENISKDLEQLAAGLIKRFERLQVLNKKDLNEGSNNLKNLKDPSQIANNISSNLNIQIFENAGWHFNNILSAEEISLKLRTYAHSEFAGEKFSSADIIKEKIKNRTDLFNRGHQYQKIEIDKTYPNYLIKNQEKFKNFII